MGDNTPKPMSQLAGDDGLDGVREVIESVCDTFIPELSEEETAQIMSTAEPWLSPQDIERYCKRSAADVYTSIVAKLRRLPKDNLEQLVFLLKAMGNPIGNFLITGHFATFHRSGPYSELSRVWLQPLSSAAI